MTTVTPEVRQAVADLRAYVETLSAAEALGEIADLSTFYAMTAHLSVAIGRPGAVRVLAELMTPLLFDLARRIDVGQVPGAGGISSTPPAPGAVRTRELVGRIFDSMAAGRS